MQPEIDYESLKKKGFLRQRQTGFFLFRTRMAQGIYDKEQLERIADVAEKFGRGFVHMTVRQGVEIPFIRYEAIPEVEARLKQAGVENGTSGARLRATTVCPGNNWCKQGLINTFELAEKIEKELGIKCGLELPHKFKIAISGCPNACTRAQQSEIGIHGALDLSDSARDIGYSVYLGGCGGKAPRMGFRLEKVFNQKEVLSLVRNVVRFYQEKALPRQRLFFLIEEMGRENFIKEISKIGE